MTSSVRGLCKGSPIGLVSVGVVALNEEAYLPGLLRDLASQDFDHSRMEILLVDGGSSDTTKRIMREFAKTDHGFARVVVLDNSKRVQPAGWNVVLGTAWGDAVIRVDAHASLALNFVSRNVEVLESGESVCGGWRDTKVPESLDTPWRRTLHLAEEAAFGSSVAAYRRDGEARYVDSVFHGAYRREVVEAVGLFNEQLLRTEDNDYHYRVRKAGYKIRFDPSIRSTQFIRSSFGRMMKQKWGNGYWIGRTLFVQPECVSLFHLAPLVFVLGIITLTSVGVTWSWVPFISCGSLYALLCIILAMRAAFQSGTANATALALPLVFFGIHISYGLGSLQGIFVGLWRRLLRLDSDRKKGEK